MEQLKNGKLPYHFIEVMGCPGGCINGGGQPRSKDPEVIQKRLKGLYKEDEGKLLRKSHENPYITAIYEEFLDEPCSHISHELLHTGYVKRGEYNEFTGERFVLSDKKPKENKAFKSRMPEEKYKKQHVTQKMFKKPEETELLRLEHENSNLRSDLRECTGDE